MEEPPRIQSYKSKMESVVRAMGSTYNKFVSMDPSVGAIGRVFCIVYCFRRMIERGVGDAYVGLGCDPALVCLIRGNLISWQA